MIKKTIIILFFSVIVGFAVFLFSHCNEDISSFVEDAGGIQKACKNSAQCDKDEVCVNNICVKKDGGSVSTCRNSNDCRPDEECINSVCQKRHTDAGSDEVGVDVIPVESIKCNYNSECPEGFVCNIETH